MNTSHAPSRQASFFWIGVAYACSFIVGWAYLQVGLFSSWHTHNVLIDTFAANSLATVVIFIFSRLFKNSSFYDAYWSVVPPIIFHYWLIVTERAITPDVIFIGIVIWYWAIRLTFNWAKHWPGLIHEDWRYPLLKEKSGKLEFFTDFFGIHYFPTIQVYLGLLPVYALMALREAPINIIDYIAFAIGISAVTIQLISDRQLHQFLKNRKPGEIIHHGLWRYSRHPNYFGELTFWLSLGVFGFAANSANISWLFLGFIAMFLMFMLASIPMMETRSLERRPEYQRIIDSTSMLIPWFPKKG